MARFTGTSGPNTIVGTKNGDDIRGGDGNDYLSGGDGNDLIYGEGGADELHGGRGNDTLYGDHGSTYSAIVDDLLYGEEGDDFLGGGNGNDYVDGGSGNDTLFGDGGDDRVAGGTGQDLIRNFHGRDILYGGEWGGTGDGERDTFHYDRNWSSNPADGIDLLADFESGIDVIDLTSFDANSTTPVSQPKRGPVTGKESFILVEQASGNAGEITLTYDPETNITTLRTYQNNDLQAELTIEIVGLVNPSTDILGIIVPPVG